MSNELIQIEEATALEVFSSQGGLDPLLDQARDVVRDFEHDLSTATSRKRTASLAMKVRRLKTRLDGMGKDLTADWAKKKKAVDTNRKAMRDELDVLAKEARQPLDEWEAEQARIEEEKRLKEEQEALAEMVEADHEMALLMNNEFDRQAEDERQRLEDERKAEEERIRQEATEKAEAEAEAERNRLENERLAAVERERRAEEQRQNEERRRIEAEENAAREAEEAAEQARLDEIERQRKEEERKAAEQAAREADIEHRKTHNRAAHAALVAEGLSQDDALIVIKAIIGGRVPHVGITY